MWFRFEWQMRGTIHVHGMIRLTSDPGLVELADVVLKGRKNERRLISLDNNGNLASYYTKYPLDHYIVNDHVKVFEEAQQFFQTIHNNRTILLQSIQEGLDAERKIIAYRDFLVTNVNCRPVLPTDAHKDHVETQFTNACVIAATYL